MVVLLEKGNYLQNCKKRGLTRRACSDRRLMNYSRVQGFKGSRIPVRGKTNRTEERYRID